MSKIRRLRAIFIFVLTLLALQAAAPGDVFAKKTSAAIPSNAHPLKFGGGWECDRGYREVKGRCAAVKVPANGYFAEASYGPGWKCNRGYRADKESCVAVKVPENGFFVDSSYGTGWQCARGYRALKASCVAVKMPKNAHLDFTGNDWACNPPHQKQQDGCALP